MLQELIHVVENREIIIIIQKILNIKENIKIIYGDMLMGLNKEGKLDTK